MNVARVVPPSPFVGRRNVQCGTERQTPDPERRPKPLSTLRLRCQRAGLVRLPRRTKEVDIWRINIVRSTARNLTDGRRS